MKTNLLSMLFFGVLFLFVSTLDAQVLEETIFEPQETRQENCTSVDLRKLGKLSTVNRTQGEIDWCYAHSAADLVQFFFASEELSAANIALNYAGGQFAGSLYHSKKIIEVIKKKKKSKGFGPAYLRSEGGFIELALKNSFEQGFCSRNVMPDEFIEKVDNQTLETQQHDYELAMREIMQMAHKGWDKHSHQYSYKIKSIKDSTLEEIVENNKPAEIFSEINNRLCSDRIFFPAPQIKKLVRGRNIFKKIDQQMNLQNLVVIDFSAKVLRDKNLSYKMFKALHTTPLVGRRWNTKENSCEYLIRNHSGSGCAKYDKSYVCEEGNIWVPQKYLKNSIIRGTYLSEK
jgi:hypothetical protein